MTASKTKGLVGDSIRVLFCLGSFRFGDQGEESCEAFQPLLLFGVQEMLCQSR